MLSRSLSPCAYDVAHARSSLAHPHVAGPSCPKEIPIDFIALMNRDYLKSKLKNRKLIGQG